MKFLFVSDDMDSLGLQTKLLDEGHEVITWIKDKESSDIGKGIVKTVDDYRRYIPWSDVVVMDSTGHGKEADALRKAGKSVVAGTAETDRMENDRVYGMKIFEKYGINVPPWYGPFNLKQALDFVKKNPNRYVLKPNGQADRDLTYVSKDDVDMISEIERFIKDQKKMSSVILQEFIEGHEIGVGSSVVKGRFLRPFQLNWEHKKLYAGNTGPNTGEQGTICYYTEESPLINELKKLEPWFAGSGYSTDFDINFIVTEDKAYALEPTSRFGYPAIFLQADTQEMSFGEYLSGMGQQTLQELEMKNPWIAGVVLSAPGYPFTAAYLKHGKDKYLPFIEKDSEDHFYFYEVEKDRYGYKTSGSNGAILVAVESGQTLEEATDNVYDLIEKKEIDSWVGFRNDIGTKLKDHELEWFIENGWINA